MEKRRFESFQVFSCLKKVNPGILSTFKRSFSQKPAAKKYDIIPKPAGTGRWNYLCFEGLSPPPETLNNRVSIALDILANHISATSHSKLVTRGSTINMAVRDGISDKH